MLNNFEQLFRLSEYRLKNPNFTYRPILNRATLHDEGLNNLLYKNGQTIKSVSTYELGELSNTVLDSIGEKLFLSSGLKRKNDYQSLQKENQVLLKIFYSYAFFELYLSVIEDQRRKIDRVLFKVLDKKNNKSSIQLYRDVMLMALYKETERILNSRKCLLENNPEINLKYVLPKIPITIDHYDFLHGTVRLEDFINYFLNKKNYENNIYSVQTEDGHKSQGLLVSFLKPKVFIRKSNYDEVEARTSFRKSIKDLNTNLNNRGITYIHVDNEFVYFGDHHLKIYFEQMHRHGIARNTRFKKICFKNLSSNLNNIMKAISNDRFKLMQIMI